MRRYLFGLLFILLVGSCSEDGGSSDGQVQPTNLNVDIVISTEVEGEVELTATADNAAYFNIDWGVGDGFIRSTDGNVTYTYAEAGTYTVIVRANATDNLYVEDQQDITVQFGTVVIDEGYTTPTSYQGYNLIWFDEFDGTTLSNDWIHRTGTGVDGWGNLEKQYYRSQNTTVANGFLIINAKKENFGGSNYTSSRIVTDGNFTFQYGRIDIRAKLPEGQGLWPALWMLGSNFGTVGWPHCGEIDIMEMIGGEGRENHVFGTLHWDNAGQNACTCEVGSGYTLSSGTFNDKFHVFTLLWNATTIQWLVDDNLYHTIDITPAELDEFRNDFFLIFNVAVGGNLPGDPSVETVFPQQMVVDYVRVFQPQ